MRFRVSVLDNNKNHILDFGSYGNVDQTGPGSKVTSPEIPLYQPIYVRVVNNNVYISDIGNERIVKVKLGHKLWKTTSGLSGTANECVLRKDAKGKLALAIAPNPFNPATTITFMVPKTEKVLIKIIAPDGREIRQIINKVCNAGPNSVIWNGLDSHGKSVAAGVYAVVIRTEKAQISKVLMLTK
jgi:hypothetical protein